MHQSRHALAERNRRIVRQYFRVAPKVARAALQAIKSKRGSGPPQVVASQKRLPAGTEVLFYQSVVFLATGGAFQLDYIRGFRHHRESLAQPFLMKLLKRLTTGNYSQKNAALNFSARGTTIPRQTLSSISRWRVAVIFHRRI